MPNSTHDAESLAARLGAHPDYRVLRRLDTSREWPALAGPTVRRAAIVDTETTGTDHSVDKVIELAVVVFEYCAASGAVGRVLGTYDGLEDPGMPIPASSTAIHGITDAMVAGQRIDDGSVASLLDASRARDCAQRRIRSEVSGAAAASVRVAAVGVFVGGGTVE